MQILPLIEFAGCGLVFSAIAWLRYLYGAPLPARDWAARYIVPFSSAIMFVLGSIIMGIQRPAPIHQPDPQDARIILGLHLISAALLVWLLVEVGHYRTRSRNVTPAPSPNPPPRHLEDEPGARKASTGPARSLDHCMLNRYVQLFETLYRSPQLPLWERSAVVWHVVQRLPEYAPVSAPFGRESRAAIVPVSACSGWLTKKDGREGRMGRRRRTHHSPAARSTA